jgi:hypothetical protein
MSIIRVVFAGILSAVVSGCSIHPLPEDVTGVPTYYIVRQIRCEARAGIIDSALGWLTSEQNVRSGQVDRQSQLIGLEFKNKQRPIQTFDPKLFKGQVKTILTEFFGTGIAYNFNLAMTETNNFDPTVNLFKPLPHAGKFTPTLSANADRTRENTRVFTVTDTFSELVQRVPDDYCNGFIVEENYIYPVAGKIGMEKMIQDFVVLTLFGNLGAPGNQSGAPSSSGGPPTLVDTLEFTTTFTFTGTPMVTFTPVGNVLQVSSAMVGIVATRKDDHKVTVGLAIPSADVGAIAGIRSTLFGPLLTAQGGRAEQAAANAVNQVLTQQVFQPTIVVVP